MSYSFVDSSNEDQNKDEAELGSQLGDLKENRNESNVALDIIPGTPRSNLNFQNENFSPNRIDELHDKIIAN